MTALRSLAAVPLALGLCATPAWSAGTGDAAMTHIAFSVRDLNPADGIEAGFHWTDTPGATVARSMVARISSPGELIPLQDELRVAPGVLSPLAVEVVAGEARGLASSGRGALRASVRSDEGLSALAHSGTGAGMVYDPENRNWWRVMQVAPYTQLTVTAEADLSVSTSADCSDPFTGEPMLCDHGSVGAELALGGPRSDDGSYSGDFSQSYLGLQPDGADASRQHSFLSVSLSNNSALPASFSFDAGVSAYLQSNVPEPAMGWLMLGGLAAVAAAVQRRRSQR